MEHKFRLKRVHFSLVTFQILPIIPFAWSKCPDFVIDVIYIKVHIIYLYLMKRKKRNIYFVYVLWNEVKVWANKRDDNDRRQNHWNFVRKCEWKKKIIFKAFYVLWNDNRMIYIKRNTPVYCFWESFSLEFGQLWKIGLSARNLLRLYRWKTKEMATKSASKTKVASKTERRDKMKKKKKKTPKQNHI